MKNAFVMSNAMAAIEIEYCVPCGLLDAAIKTQRELLSQYGRDLDGIRLTPGHGGVFKVFVDGELVFDKDNHGNEIDLDIIGEAVDDRIAAEA